MLRGGPFGGIITLFNNRLRKMTTTVVCDERFLIGKIGDALLINVYLHFVVLLID